MTTEEIAKALGVSKSTVSRALSGKGRIGKETVQRIQSYAREHGFWEERKTAQQDKSSNIAVVVPADAYVDSIPFFQESLLGIDESLEIYNYNVLIVADVPGDVSNIKKIIEREKAEGIILLRSVEGDLLQEYLAGIDFPTGVIGKARYADMIQVDVDNRKAAENLVSLLGGQGYRKFCMVGGDTTYYVNQERAKGYFDGLEGMKIPKEQLYYPNFIDIESDGDVIRGLLAQKVECVICGDDVICAQITSRLQAEGFRIPKDISVASLYNSKYLGCFSPQITAVSVSARTMGNIVGKQLISKLRGEAYRSDILVDYDILNRRSTRRFLEM